MQTLTLNAKRTITLPRRIFKPNDKIAFFVEGGTVILKKLLPLRLSDMASRAKDNPLSLHRISSEVRAYRKERHHHARSS